MKEKELEDICSETPMIACAFECDYESECEEYYHKHGVIPCEGKDNKDEEKRTDG